MSLKYISYSTATDIIDLYSQLLMTIPDINTYRRHSYSDLKGNTVIDICNAFKVLISNDVYYNTSNDENVKRIKGYADSADSSLAGFDRSFYPDDVVERMKQINPNDKDALLQFMRLTAVNEETDINQLSMKQETVSSFTTYCFHIKDQVDYMKLANARIGINETIAIPNPEKAKGWLQRLRDKIFS